MPMLVFATASQYEEFAEEPFEDPGDDDARLNKRLRSASVEVQKLVRLAVYDIDEDGYPSDEDVALAFAEATVAIVEYWEETGDHTGAAELEGAVKIGSVSLGTTSSGASTDTPRDKLIKRLGTKAVDILENARLFSGPSY